MLAQDQGLRGGLKSRGGFMSQCDGDVAVRREEVGSTPEVH